MNRDTILRIEHDKMIEFIEKRKKIFEIGNSNDMIIGVSYILGVHEMASALLHFGVYEGDLISETDRD